ncbi:MAG: patatin-like phospholipase family protein [Synergistes sp.]|nr:patatin-like phospholipase family protein [Synergistes sp.]
MRSLYRLLISAALIIATSVNCAAAQFAPDSEETRDHMREWGFRHRDGIVLALCGGGTKGLAHLGVFEVLERENIPIAAIIGTSMGAIMGGLYASGLTTAEMRDILSKSDLMEIISGRSRSDLSSGFNSPPVQGEALLSITVDKDKNERGRLGMLDAKDLYTFLSELTSGVAVTDFDYLPIPFAAVATNLENGDTVVLRNGNLASALRASMSIPVIFDPWPMNGMLMADGGLKANLPVLEAKKLFPGHPVVAVNLSPQKIDKKPEEFRSMFDVASQTLDILMLQSILENVKAADLVIEPDVRGLGTLQSSGYDKIMDLGRAAADEKIDELKKLVAEKCDVWDHNVAGRSHRTPPTVAQVRFEGVPEGVAEELHEKYDVWIGEPLDMKKVAETVRHLSARDDIKSVDDRIEIISRGSMAVIFNIERPAKFEFSLDGFASNMYWNRWISLTGTARDTLMQGDVASLELRMGTTWGAMLRYFTVNNERDAQWGLTLAGRREKYVPYEYDGDSDFSRYTAKIAWYKTFANRTRLGIGYAVQRVTSIADGPLNDHGPYLAFTFDTLDDPILPSKGLAVRSEMWYPAGETLVSNTRFRAYLPLFKGSGTRVIFGGGLKTGDADSLAYAAMLGIQDELYSLGQHPLIGDQAYWLHLGLERAFMRTWWGGVNLEIFGNYGQTFRNWSRSGSRWEVGAALSIPTNRVHGRLIFVYDDDGGFTVGYTLGIPRFWDGPLP